MASLLERLKYIIEDIFGKKTYAESQRDKYKKVVRNLEKELKKTDNLSDVMAQLATDYNTMEMNPDSAQGKLSDTFVTKESENREAVEKLGADFKEIIAEVKSKLEFARDEYNYWCDEAKRENDIIKSISNTEQLAIELIQDCNLQCKYCIYGSLYKNPFKYNKIKSNDVQKIIDRLLCYWEFGVTKNIRINYYGGEPLLRFEDIQQITEYIKSKNTSVNFTFGLTTNGTLLDAYKIDYFVKNNFVLAISLDGNEESIRAQYMRIFVLTMQKELQSWICRGMLLVDWLLERQRRKCIIFWM